MRSDGGGMRRKGGRIQSVSAGFNRSSAGSNRSLAGFNRSSRDSIDLRGIQSVFKSVDERPRAMSEINCRLERTSVTFSQGDSQLNEYRVVDDNRGLSGLSYLLLENRLRNTA